MVIPRMSRPAPRASSIPLQQQTQQPPQKLETPEPRREAPADLPLPAFFMETKPAGRKVPVFAMVAVAAVLLGGAVFYFGGNAILGGSAPVQADAVRVSPLLPVGPAGWSVVADWPRRISLLRGYNDLTNFRMEFEGTIDDKALGWVIRAADAKNYYAMKLEIVTPGRDPVVVLKRFAVINGQDQDVIQVPLSSTSRLDTFYKIRVETLGDQFTVWVQDRKVDQWKDSRIGSGAIGLYNDRMERGSVKGDVKVFQLERK